MPREPRYLRQMSTGRVYVYTDELAKRADMQLMSTEKARAAFVPGEISEPIVNEDEPETELAPGGKRISHMNKDELEAYAMFHFGIEIDKRHTTLELRKEVAAMAQAQS